MHTATASRQTQTQTQTLAKATRRHAAAAPSVTRRPAAGLRVVPPAPARSAPPEPAGSPAVPVGWGDLVPIRGYLVAFARRKLLDPSLAEDLVHDVFDAVISGRAVFGGRSALRSWLVAILKHKIVDLVRQRVGHDSLETDDEFGTGPVLECPQPRPDEVAEQRQRLRRTLARIGKLPDTLREAVELRLLHDQDTVDVCRTLAITEQNLFVRLHRARKALDPHAA